MATKGNLGEVVTTCERSWVQASPWGFSFKGEKGVSETTLRLYTPSCGCRGNDLNLSPGWELEYLRIRKNDTSASPRGNPRTKLGRERIGEAVLTLALRQAAGLRGRHSPINPRPIWITFLPDIYADARSDYVPSGHIRGHVPPHYSSPPVSLTMSEEDQTVDITALPKFDMSSHESSMSAKDVKSLTLRHGVPLDLHPVALTKGWTMNKLSDDMMDLYKQYFKFSGIRDVETLAERVIDLRPIPFGLLFQGGLAITWDFPGFRCVFKDTEGNVVTMSEYLRFPFLSVATIEKGNALTNQDLRERHIVPLLPADQAISDKTGHQKEKREKKKRGVDEGDGSRPQGKRKKTSAARRDSSATTGHVSSPKPIRVADPVGLNTENLSGAAANIAESQGNQSLHDSHHDSANHSVHKDQTVRNLTLVPTEVLQSFSGDHFVHRSPTAERATSHARLSVQGAHANEGESSRDQAYYVLEWFIHRRCRVDNPMWCRELMIHLAPPAAQEESNALDNSTAFERAWFALGRGALAQADILERFENLQADYNSLAETRGVIGSGYRVLSGRVESDFCFKKLTCNPTRLGFGLSGSGGIRLLEAREALQQSSRLYLEMSERFKKLKNDHAGCIEQVRLLEGQNSEFLRAQEKERLAAQLSKSEMEKFDCIRKLIPTVVERLFQSHEYKQSLSEPFNLSIQAGWGKGLTKERSEEEILGLMSRMENFDAYADKKMRVEYDNLFEK
nr:hypothetical protein [Tanacetum cinerariifolium]